MIINYPLLIYHGAAPLAAGCVRLMRRDTTRHSPPSRSVDIQHITDNSVQGGRWPPGPGAGARLESSQLWVRVQAAAAVQCPGPASSVSLCWSGQSPPRACAPVQCPGYNGRNSELKFNHWCWSKLVSDLLIVFPNPIL